MMRYVAIGAVAGFLAAVLLLSTRQAPPIALPPVADLRPGVAPLTPPAGDLRQPDVAAQTVDSRVIHPPAELHLSDGPLRHAPLLLRQQMNAAAADGG